MLCILRIEFYFAHHGSKYYELWYLDQSKLVSNEGFVGNWFVFIETLQFFVSFLLCYMVMVKLSIF